MEEGTLLLKEQESFGPRLAVFQSINLRLLQPLYLPLQLELQEELPLSSSSFPAL